MADQKNTDKNRATEPQEERICGIIMPISATSNHSAEHWAEVLTLITRAIEKAKFVATPVWKNSVIDRVSKRIIENIFKFPIVVADISDSNPNVMLELGLRLASKKPTIVIINKGGSTPFDIADFHAIRYPPSLSILEMEKFIDELALALQSMHDAFLQNNYSPFLDNIVVDVLKPGKREVDFDDYVLERLNEINVKISSMSDRYADNELKHAPEAITSAMQTDLGTAFFFRVNRNNHNVIANKVRSAFPAATLYSIKKSIVADYWALKFQERMDGEMVDHVLTTLETVVGSVGAQVGVPASVATSFKLI